MIGDRRNTTTVLLRLAWPVAITGLLAELSEVIVIFWLSRLLGGEALAVEATLRPVVQTVGWILLSIGSGVSVLVAQSVGARDGRGLRIIGSGQALNVVAWALVALVVLPTSGLAAHALASPAVPESQLLAYGVPMVLLMLPGLGMLQILLFAASGAGWTRLSLVRMVADLCITAVVVPIFIAGFRFGLVGAALGQALPQFLMAALVYRSIVHRRESLHLGAPATRAQIWNREYWGQILDIGLPPQLARIAMFGAYSYLVQRVARDGQDAVIGYGIALMLTFFTMNLSSSIARATGIELAQSAGARDADRARWTLRVGFELVLLLSVIVIAIMLALAPVLVGLLVSGEAMIAHGVHALRIFVLGLPALGIAQVCLYSFTALKASKRAGVLGIVADAIGVGFAIAAPFESQLDAAAWAFVVANILRAIGFAVLARSVVSRALEFR